MAKRERRPAIPRRLRGWLPPRYVAIPPDAMLAPVSDGALRLWVWLRALGWRTQAQWVDATDDELAELVGRSRQAVSRLLGELERAGMVARQGQGRERLVKATDFVPDAPPTTFSFTSIGTASLQGGDCRKNETELSQKCDSFTSALRARGLVGTAAEDVATRLLEAAGGDEARAMQLMEAAEREVDGRLGLLVTKIRGGWLPGGARPKRAERSPMEEMVRRWREAVALAEALGGDVAALRDAPLLGVKPPNGDGRAHLVVGGVPPRDAAALEEAMVIVWGGEEPPRVEFQLSR